MPALIALTPTMLDSSPIDYYLTNLLTQESINSIDSPILIKNMNGAVIAANQGYLKFKRASSCELVGLTMYDLLPQSQADLHALADQYLLFSGLNQYEYEGYEEEGPIKITIKRIRFGVVKSHAILMTIDTGIKLVDSTEIKIRLTDREHCVLQLLIHGNSQKEIAKLLTLSQHTVGGYLKGIYAKLGVQSNAQAVVKAIFKLGMRPQHH